MQHSTPESRVQKTHAIEQLADQLTELAAHLDAGEYRFLVLLNVVLHGTASHVEKQVQLYRRVKRIEALEKENNGFASKCVASIV